MAASVLATRFEWWWLVGAGVVAALAARTAATRAGVTVLVGALALGVPWIAAPLLGGLTWLLVAREPMPDLPRGRSAIVAVGLGLGCGLVALPLAVRQAAFEPLVLPVARQPWWLLATAVLVLALANAVGEELLWRGAVLRELAGSPRALVLVVQAASFGLAHWYGLPGGVVGVVLTAAFSLVCVAVHDRWGLGASILTHVAADLVLFAVMARYLVFDGWLTG